MLKINDIIVFTAPDSIRGLLHRLPNGDQNDTIEPLGCDWRFRCWEHIPATITGDVDSIQAIYFPTFNVDYNTNGGSINDVSYTHWYEYSGFEADEVDLPVNVTKPGYEFAGWYQESTTELFTVLTCNYYGDYSKGKSCTEIECDYRLKAHWVLPCDEPQTLSKVVLTGSGTSSYTTSGYNNNEYVGTPIVHVSSNTAAFDVDEDGNNETGYQLASPGDIVFATIKSGTTFRVGDKIRVAVTSKNTTEVSGSGSNFLRIYYGNGVGDPKLLIHLNIPPKPGEWRGIYEYTLDADDVMEMTEAGATGVGVWHASVQGENPYVHSVEIYGCRDLVFDNATGDHKWSTAGNWAPTYAEVPSYYQSVRIMKPCIVDGPNAHAKLVKLCQEYEGHTGSLTINADAALTVLETIREVHGIDYVTTYPVSASDILIKSSASNQGALVHGDTENKTHATVEFYARGVVDINHWDLGTWQYMGVPFNDVTDAQEHYYGAWMAQWIEDTSGDINANWTWIAQYDALTPFAGYGLTQEAAKIYTNSGTLVPSSNQTLTLTASGSDYKGWNMFANSWMAPIRITQFNAADFGEAEQTIYLFNTGHNAGDQSSFSETSTAGQYLSIPIASASSMGTAYQYIAPMQGFYILTETATTVTLNYDRLVRNPAGHESDPISVLPSRAPRRIAEEETTMPRIVIDVTGSRFSDRLYIFENEEQTNGFDNGWDGYKFEGDDYAPQLMTRTDDLDLAVDVSPSFEGKRIAFRAGEDEEYTLHFSTTENGLWIRDLITDYETEIAEENTYSFSASNTTSEERFEIIDRRQAEEVTTGFSEVGEYDGDLIAQTVYTIDGRLVLKRTSDFNQPLRLSQTGVYLLELQTTTGTKIKKITF